MSLTVLREHTAEAAPPVTSMELFFDLVYVFAVTQLSEYLGAHLDRAWSGPDPHPVPCGVVGVELHGVGDQLDRSRAPSGRTADARVDGDQPGHVGGDPGGVRAPGVSRSRWRTSRSSCCAAPLWCSRPSAARRWAATMPSCSPGRRSPASFWVAGAFVHGDARLVVWLIALVLDLSAPMHGFALPGIAGTPIEQWTLPGGHLAERMQLVLLIALGESVLRAGETFASANREPRRRSQRSSSGSSPPPRCGPSTSFARAELGATAIRALGRETRRASGGAAYAYAHADHGRWRDRRRGRDQARDQRPWCLGVGAVAATILGGPALYLCRPRDVQALGPPGRRIGPPLGGASRARDGRRRRLRSIGHRLLRAARRSCGGARARRSAARRARGAARRRRRPPRAVLPTCVLADVFARASPRSRS